MGVPAFRLRFDVLRDTKIVDDWLRAFTHESGHAAMAAVQLVRCYGIFLRKFPMIATALVPPLPPPSEQTNGHRLFLAAGSAAERIIFHTADSTASKEDRRIFGNPQGTTFDEKVAEAEPILLKRKPAIEGMAARLYGMYKKSGGDFSAFPSQLVDMGEGVQDYWVLLNEEELKEELKDVDQSS
jgi:hypothetical protein